MSPVSTLRTTLRNLAREQEAASRAAQRAFRNARAKQHREQAAIERERANG